MINKLHGLSPSGGLVSPSGGFASLLFDQVRYFASIKLCQALSRQGDIIKIPVVRCHYLLCSSAQLSLCAEGGRFNNFEAEFMQVIVGNEVVKNSKKI